MRHSLLASPLLAGPLLAGLSFAAVLAAAPLAWAQDAIRTYPLPETAAYPEGVAVDPALNTAYTGSANTGVITAVDLTSGATRVIGDPLEMADAVIETPRSVSLGLKADGRGRLWVAGGRTGTMHLVDIASGRRLAHFTAPLDTIGMMNDVVLTPDAAYFTDTLRPYLWRVPLDASSDAVLEPWLSFDGTALEYGPESNLNGIAATPDGRHLIVVQMKAGKLFHIDTTTREVTRIDVGDEAIDSGDGLVLDGRRLYLVRQREGEVVALDLSEDFSSGTVAKRIKPAELAWPATAALHDGRLIVANSQLNRRGSGDPVLPFSLVSIPLSAFD